MECPTKVILTSFHRSKRMEGEKFSICRFQPAGFNFPELRFFSAEDASGNRLRIRDIASSQEFAVQYRQALASRWVQVRDWLADLQSSHGRTILLLCWCPYSEDTRSAVKNGGTFLCHSGLIGKLINKHCPDVRLLLDEDRALRLDEEWRPERYEVVDATGNVEVQGTLF